MRVRGIAGTRRARIAIAATGATLLLAGLVVRDPNTAGFYPACPFRALSGLDCPGCGSLRALHALLHGDVAAAFGFNLLLVVGLLLTVVLFIRAAPRRADSRAVTQPAIPDAVRTWAPVVIIAFWVLRNISLPMIDGLAS